MKQNSTRGFNICEPPHCFSGFWQRFVAALIDGLVIEIALYPVNEVIDRFSGPTNDAGLDAYRFVFIVVPWLYFALMEGSVWQATLGKKAVGIRVCNLSGERISYMRATIRHFGRILSSLLLLAGFIMMVFTKRRQGLHDMIAGTLVIRDSGISTVIRARL